MRPLTHQEKVAAFTAATRALTHWYAEELKAGVTDERLAQMLEAVLGIHGGSGGPGRMDVAHQGAGLKIWASWDGLNTVTDKPIFSGAATLKMAREVYQIPNPAEGQFRLL